MITVAEQERYLPHLSEQLHVVLAERARRTPAGCRKHLDSLRAVIVESGDRG
jgi:hypothetical protein